MCTLNGYLDRNALLVLRTSLVQPEIFMTLTLQASVFCLFFHNILWIRNTEYHCLCYFFSHRLTQNFHVFLWQALCMLRCLYWILNAFNKKYVNQQTFMSMLHNPPKFCIMFDSILHSVGSYRQRLWLHLVNSHVNCRCETTKSRCICIFINEPHPYFWVAA